MAKSEHQKLTKTLLSGLPLPERGNRPVIYDTEVPKLAVRITHTGVRSFYVVKRMGRSMVWLKLGTFPDMTCEQARSEASKALGEFAKGQNPAEVKRAVKAEMTFGEAFEIYLDRKRKRDGSPISDKTKRDYKDLLRLYLDGIKQKKLSAIERNEIKSIHSRTTKKSAAQADRVLTVVSAVYGFMLAQELYAGDNPATRIQKNPAPSRDRFLQPDELGPFFKALSEFTSAVMRDFFLLALLTGARRSNVSAMRWVDVDLVAGVWRIAKTKNGTPQTVTLSPEAVVVLEARKDARVGFVFPGDGKAKHIVEPKNAWARLLRVASAYKLLNLLALDEQEHRATESMVATELNKAEQYLWKLAARKRIKPEDASMADLRIHDLRRTLGSWQARTGASLPIIGKSLNHKTHQATAIYARLDLDPVRQSVNTATVAMLNAAGLRQPTSISGG